MSPTSCSDVAERSPISRRPIADQSPTSFNDSHAPILTKLVGDRSATSRRLIGDWSATSPGPVCDQISRSQVFVHVPRLVADFSATSPGQIGDLVATSAIGENCQSRRGRRAVAVYVWLGFKRFCSKGWLCIPIHIHALVPPPLFLHLNKYKENLLKLLKHLNLLYEHSSTYKHINCTNKINVD